LLEAREAVAAENTSRMACIRRSCRDDVGLVGRIDFTDGTGRSGDEVLAPLPYPRTAILHKIGAREVYYRTDPPTAT
jgi:hypothetical protein